MKEIWKDIPGWEGMYQASSLGRIRGVPRYVICKDGKSIFVRGCIRKPHITKTCQYLCVVLSRNRVFTNHLVHLLVAETFYGKPSYKCEINHIDGNPLNNCIDNLEWCTRSENQRHAMIMGLRNDSGYNNSRAKFTKEQVIEMRKRYERGERMFEIAKDYNCHRYTVSLAIRKKTYKNV